MGPSDFLDMVDGYDLREKRRSTRRDEELYLLRLLTTTMYNAHHKTQHQKKAADLFPIPSIDRQQRIDPDKLKKESDALFARAKENGNL